MSVDTAHAADAAVRIGGQAPVSLHRDMSGDGKQPEFLHATLLPGRGMNFFQARAWFPDLGEIDLLASPTLEEAQKQLSGGPDDFMGVHSFRFGGALLLPFANRIRGELMPDGSTIRTKILEHDVLLPADWHGSHPGAEKCAMHGLILGAGMDVTHATPDYVKATLNAGDFDGHWLSSTSVTVKARLRAASVEFSATAVNAGNELLPVGIGWHPYFALPSEQREQVRLHLPAYQRALVNNYDDVFPTGQLEAVAGTPYDFTGEHGAALGSRYFDDSFVHLQKTAQGHTLVEILDPAAHYGVRLTALSPHVRALQVYSRPDQAFVVVEPQFNWADPFSSIWAPGLDTGMVVLSPGEHVTWAVRCELFVTEGLS
jgi:galactose mutarotase-like enzyme